MPVLLIPIGIGLGLAALGLGCSQAKFEKDNTAVTVKKDGFGRQLGLDYDGGTYQDTFNLKIRFPAGEGGEEIAVYTTDQNGYGGLCLKVRAEGTFPNPNLNPWSIDDVSSPTLSEVLYIGSIKYSNLVDGTVHEELVQGRGAVEDYSDYQTYPIPKGFLNKNAQWLEVEITFGLNVPALPSKWVAKVYKKIADKYELYWDSYSNEWQTNIDLDPFLPVDSTKTIDSNLRITLLKKHGQDPAKGRIINVLSNGVVIQRGSVYDDAVYKSMDGHVQTEEVDLNLISGIDNKADE